jgi:hypothetical protein
MINNNIHLIIKIDIFPINFITLSKNIKEYQRISKNIDCN